MEVKKAAWYLNRLGAMSFREMIWRTSQYTLQLSEKRRYGKERYSAASTKIYEPFVKEKITQCNVHRLPFVTSGRAPAGNLSDSFLLFEQFPVKINNIDWHATFFNANSWPLQIASEMNWKQNNRFGDARVNWELNRHHVLQMLAMEYYNTRNPQYKKCFQDIFYSWLAKNPFFIGISYTSVMEMAIRSLSWLVAAWFLEQAGDCEKVCNDLEKAILNHMTYVYKHNSKFSSANNHLIIEMMVLGITGVTFEISQWIELSIGTLTAEISKQNHADGVNKEQSIHYQTFVMEAYALFVLTLRKNGLSCPEEIITMLEKMCEFVADLSDLRGNIADIGDNDEGKLLTLTNDPFNHYSYVLQLLSILLEKNYTSFKAVHPNLYWLFPREEIQKQRPEYSQVGSKCYRLGGHTILKHRRKDKERLLTFDHAELGYGSIAAHGHADALSITLSVDGEKIILDPGTYIYHIELPWRDYFRKTCNHNTICMNNKDQSEMKGPFLWGRRANATLLHFTSSNKKDTVKACHDGYKPVIHSREISYQKPDLFIIQDSFRGSKSENFEMTFCLSPHLKVKQTAKDVVEIISMQNKIFLKCSQPLCIEECWVSRTYATREKSIAIKCRGNTCKKTIKTYLSIHPGL